MSLRLSFVLFFSCYKKDLVSCVFTRKTPPELRWTSRQYWYTQSTITRCTSFLSPHPVKSWHRSHWIYFGNWGPSTPTRIIGCRYKWREGWGFYFHFRYSETPLPCLFLEISPDPYWDMVWNYCRGFRGNGSSTLRSLSYFIALLTETQSDFFRRDPSANDPYCQSCIRTGSLRLYFVPHSPCTP